MKFYRVILIIAVLVTGCSKNFNKQATTGELIIFPFPPDTARIQYLTSISSSEDIFRKKSSFANYVIGSLASQPILQPYGLAINKGRLFVCDVKMASLEIIDLEKRTFDYFSPAGLGRLKVPVNCFVDEKGFLYIADTGREQVVIFNENLKYVDSFRGPEEFKPTDVFINDDKIWVSNILDHRIYVYRNDSTHEFLHAFPEAKQGEDGYLYQPTNIYVTMEYVYVSDFADCKIKIYTHEGKFVSVVGSFGRGLGQFVRPKGIAVDRDLNLYVADAAFENVQIFNRDGKFLMPFGGPYTRPGDMYLPAKVIIDYDNMKYFLRYVDERYDLKYLVLVSNGGGPDKINVYGFIEQKK